MTVAANESRIVSSLKQTELLAGRTTNPICRACRWPARSSPQTTTAWIVQPDVDPVDGFPADEAALHAPRSPCPRPCPPNAWWWRRHLALPIPVDAPHPLIKGPVVRAHRPGPHGRSLACRPGNILILCRLSVFHIPSCEMWGWSGPATSQLIWHLKV